MFILACLACSNASAEPLSLGSGPHLFIDDFVEFFVLSRTPTVQGGPAQRPDGHEEGSCTGFLYPGRHEEGSCTVLNIQFRVS